MTDREMLKNLCVSCEGKGKAQRLFEDKIEQCWSCKGSGIASRYTENLICPYCGHEDSESWELSESDSKYQCGSCEKFFSYETETIREFISRQVPCLNGGEHKMGMPMDIDTYFYVRCRDCDYSERTPKASPPPSPASEKGEG